MKFADATKFDRKSGGAERRDLQFMLIEKRNLEVIRLGAVPLCPKVKLQISPLRSASVGMTKWRVALLLGMVERDGQSQPSHLLNASTLRFGRDDKVEGGAAPWHGREGWTESTKLPGQRAMAALKASLTMDWASDSICSRCFWSRKLSA